MRCCDDILIPEPDDPYEPLLATRSMTFDAFLDFGAEEERWELIDGFPALPERKTTGTRRLEGHLRHLLQHAVPDGFDVWGQGALVRTDARTALIPSGLVEPRPPQSHDVLICSPVLVVEASYGLSRDRAILHDRRARYLSPNRTPALAEYVAVIDSGRESDPGATGSKPGDAMNFVSGAGRQYVPAGCAQRVYRFDRDGVTRYAGTEEVPLASIGVTLPASTFFPEEGA